MAECVEKDEEVIIHSKEGPYKQSDVDKYKFVLLEIQEAFGAIGERLVVRYIVNKFQQLGKEEKYDEMTAFQIASAEYTKEWTEKRGNPID
jgi:hypothetical protein